LIFYYANDSIKEWYVPDDHKHWQRLHDNAAQIKATGIDNIWVPPGCKASSQSGNGYDIYDLYDLGEFDQKGGVGTKWGTKAELVKLVEKANEVGLGIYWDAGAFLTLTPWKMKC
jgi:alpha-amylase